MVIAPLLSHPSPQPGRFQGACGGLRPELAAPMGFHAYVDFVVTFILMDAKPGVTVFSRCSGGWEMPSALTQLGSGGATGGQGPCHRTGVLLPCSPAPGSGSGPRNLGSAPPRAWPCPAPALQPLPGPWTLNLTPVVWGTVSSPRGWLMGPWKDGKREGRPFLLQTARLSKSWMQAGWAAGWRTSVGVGRLTPGDPRFSDPQGGLEREDPDTQLQEHRTAGGLRSPSSCHASPASF